jgi:hypothetical protein
MPATTVLSRDATTIMSEGRHFNWGAVIAGAFAATAMSFFLLTLGAGIGLALVSPARNSTGGAAFLTLGAIYFLAVQAFGFATGGYLVGRLIGPEVETTEEEEFRAAAHGFVMWALVIVVSLLLAGFSSVVAGSTISGDTFTSATATSGYWTDVLFRPAANTPAIAADKAEAGRILTSNLPKGGALNRDDSARIADLVSRDAGIPMTAATARVTDVQSQMRNAASILSLWTAFALLLGALVAVATAISSRWIDDRITFSFASRR